MVDPGISHTSETTNPPDTHLSYCWDGECHLVVNNNFYSYLPHSPEDNIMDTLQEPEVGLLDLSVNPCGLMDDIMSCPDYDSESVSSSKSLSESTTGTVHCSKSASGATYNKSLDMQLDFIMESTKKPPKPQPPEKKYVRSRKTKKQLDVLTKELKNLKEGQNITKEKVANISLKTGLQEMKVYKWFWDRGYKLQ